MHEMTIATSLLEHVLEIANRQRADRIEEIEVEVGVLQQVVPESLELAFAAVAAGTVAEGATLRLVAVPVEASCRHCRKRFRGNLDDYLCPHCRQADVDILAGRDIILKTVVCRTEAEVPAP